jgi:uncharacterized protein YndB with AHSA1/START domain
MTQSTDTRELVISRIFNAPRERVYQAFTDPGQLAQWFGPAGFSVPRDSIEIDARVGGHQRFVMVCDDDPEMKLAVNATFADVVENELLVGSEVWPGAQGNRGLVGIFLWLDFDDEAGKTRLALRQGPYSEAMAGMARERWSSSFIKLDALLAG